VIFNTNKKKIIQIKIIQMQICIWIQSWM